VIFLGVREDCVNYLDGGMGGFMKGVGGVFGVAVKFVERNSRGDYGVVLVVPRLVRVIGVAGVMLVAGKMILDG
jgi:hypothetical protein